MDVYAGIVTEKDCRHRWSKVRCRGANLGLRDWICRAISYRKNHTTASTIFCFPAFRKYVSPFWLTYRQATELGGHVRKGEESTLIVYWKVDAVKQSTEELESDESKEKNRRRFLLRFYRVFNLEQCELPHAVLEKLPKIGTHEHDPIEAAERIIAGMPNPPEIVRGGSKAFYSSITDRITLPTRELFISAEEQIATTYHEMSHAAGHPKRLNRKSITEAAPFGSPTYSFEEMIAEMSAAYLCAEAGISPAVLENQAAYVAGWLK